MHQSNLAGDRLGYPVMDGILSAYRAVYGASAPIVNLPMSGDGVVLHNQQLWATALREGLVTAWVQGNTVTISGPPRHDGPGHGSAGTTVGIGRTGLRQPVRRRAVGIHDARLASAQARPQLGSVQRVTGEHPGRHQRPWRTDHGQ